MNEQSKYNIDRTLTLLECLLPYGELVKGVDVTRLVTTIEDVLNTIPPREKYVLEKRFGLRNGTSQTLESIGIEFNVTRETIRQIQNKALRRLCHPVRQQRLRTIVTSLMVQDLVGELKKLCGAVEEMKTRLFLKEKGEQLTIMETRVLPFNESIDILGLSTRARNCLTRGGIDTLGKLATYSDKQLLKIRCCGQGSLREIREKLAQRLEAVKR